MTIKNIIFDFGGVLMDWNPEYLFKKIFTDKDKLKYFLDNVCHLKWNYQFDEGKPIQEGIDELIEQYPEYTEEIKIYKDRWLEMIKGEISENTALIKPLSKKYSLYGLTNWSAETFPLVFEKYNFFKIFKGIVVSGTEKVIKPNPKIYNILLSRYNLKAEESIFIDDNIENIKIAKELGIKAIHYTTDTKLKDELAKYGIS